MARAPKNPSDSLPKNTKADPRARAKAARRRRYAENKADELAEKAATLEADGKLDLKAANKALLAEDGDAARAARGEGKKTQANTIRASDNLTLAFDLMGGVPALVRWGKRNATEFYRIWARLIPKEAVEASTQQPLENLLEQLATKSEKSVAEAAYEIGQETLARARNEVAIEDAIAAHDRSVH